MHGDDKELHGWDAIASYLGTSARTAQEHGKKNGLPVHRLPGPRGRVWAYSQRLDEWRTQYKKRPAEEEAASQNAGIIPPSAGRRSAWKLIGAGISSTVVVGVLVAALWRNPGLPPLPEDIEVRGNLLIAQLEDGAELWRHTFDDPLRVGAYVSDPKRWALADIDRTPGMELLFHKFPTDDRDHRLACFSQTGKLLWSFSPGRPVVTEGPAKLHAPYFINNFQVFQDSGQTKVVVSSNHHLVAPNQIAVLGRDGKLVGEYWHPGHLYHIGFADLRHTGRQELILAGVNNGQNAATLLVFDPRNVQGTAGNVSDKRYELTDFPPGTERIAMLFPRSCIATAKGKVQPYNRVSSMRVMPHGIILTVAEGVDMDRNPTVAYELDYLLNVVNVFPSVPYRHRHNEFHRAGLLDHPYSDAEAELLKKRVVYLRR